MDPISRLMLFSPQGAEPGAACLQNSLLKRPAPQVPDSGADPTEDVVDVVDPIEAFPVSMAEVQWRISSDHLACSLVVPRNFNASILETSLLDCFAYSESAFILHVSRNTEYAPVRQAVGLHSAAAARSALNKLHRGWLAKAGAMLDTSGAMRGGEGVVEISPLLTYEGEGLEALFADVRISEPQHFAAPEEEESDVRAPFAAGCCLPARLELEKAMPEWAEVVEIRLKSEFSNSREEFSKRPALSTSLPPSLSCRPRGSGALPPSLAAMFAREEAQSTQGRKSEVQDAPGVRSRSMPSRCRSRPSRPHPQPCADVAETAFGDYPVRVTPRGLASERGEPHLGPASGCSR